MIDATSNEADVALNLRRLMAERGLTLGRIGQLTGLDQRTIHGVLAGRCRPHARTLHKLVQGLAVPADELFQTDAGRAHRRFDRQTNPRVDEVVRKKPALFAGWSAADFDELYSRFGTGGALTDEGVREAAERMNRDRDVQRRVAVVLESDERDVLIGMVNLLYQKASDMSR